MWDVAVLGGGAAGLLAAWRAADRGARVLLLEKNRRAGAKILASGGSRCNLTTTRSGVALERSFRAAQGAFLRFAFRAFPPERLRAFFEERGVALHEERWEKVFPDAGKASVVLEALLRSVAEKGVGLVTGARVAGVDRSDGGGFAIRTTAGAFAARTIVLAVGGRSYPKLGTTGDGYAIAETLGHDVTPLFPALVGLTLAERDLAELAGIAIEDAAVHLVHEGKRIHSSERPLLFTHSGISGPGPMNLGGEVEARGGADLEIDLVAAMSAENLERELGSESRAHPRRNVAGILPAQLPERLRAHLVARAGVPPEVPAGQLPRETRRRLVHLLKALPVRATGTLGYDRAEVTRGGIALADVDPRSLASRRVPGLYVAGEILDVDGPIGGFNFQAAFATGYVAGESAARAAG